MCDGKARPLSLVLSEGQRHDSGFLEPVLDAVRVPRPGKLGQQGKEGPGKPSKPGKGRPRKRPSRLLQDKGYSFATCRGVLRRRGIKHMIPERSNQRAARKKRGRDGGRPVLFVKAQYAKRNVVERCILRLKQWRRVATRYDKRASMFLAFVTLASIILWTR